MENVPYDWADDDSMSAEETLRRFQALNPEPTNGPPARNFQVQLVDGEVIVSRPKTGGPLAHSATGATGTRMAADPRRQRMMFGDKLAATT